MNGLENYFRSQLFVKCYHIEVNNYTVCLLFIVEGRIGTLVFLIWTLIDSCLICNHASFPCLFLIYSGDPTIV